MQRRSVRTAFVLAGGLAFGACDGTYVVDPNGPPIDLTVAANRGSLDPLVFVDGVRSTLEEVSSLDRGRIARIEVVKGAAATTRYGERAQHGVVNITLKP